MFKHIATITTVLLASSAPDALAQDAPAPAAPPVAAAATPIVGLVEAITVAVNSNPQVAQAQYNTEAIQFERKQAQGLYAPRVDVEGSAGVRRLDNATRRAIGLDNQTLYPLEAQVRADWTVLDFGRRRGELLRQAARVDGASLRVLERSEFIALQVTRQYLEVLLQQRVVAATEDNVSFHRALAADLATGVTQGSISVADQQQAEERVQAAVVRQAEAEQDLAEARIKLQHLTGLDIANVQMPPQISAGLPISIDEAVGLARSQNPLVREASADVDAANAQAASVKGDGYPKIGVELTGRYGDDVDGFRGRTTDLQARGYLRWNIFDGGINRANYQEMVRRASEARYKLYEVTRQSEEDVRTAWTTMRTQNSLVGTITTQSKVSDDLLLSYRSQFNVGRRSLLDVLDAQNSRYNTQVRLETARFSEIFAQYQLLAATNRLLDTLKVAPGAGAGMTERNRFGYGPPVPAELQYRTNPK